jgi:hypothetical protein
LIQFIDVELNPKKWLTANTPHYARFSMDVIDKINELSKISLSLAGAGRICFRMSESPRNSVMYLWEDEMAHSHPWINGINCIRSKEGTEIETIIQALNNPSLYDVYVAGVENCRNYELKKYIQYIEEKIEEHT